MPTLDIHPVERYLGIGPMLGLDDGPADFSFPIPQEARARIDALVDYYEIAKAKLLVMAPGTNWETKEWRREAFAEVARHFMKNSFAVTLIGSERERALCEDVAKLAPGAINLAGETTLSELAALISRATICVTNDSGPMHLAVALGRPVVSIFGPTDPVWAGPYRRDGAVLRADLPCSPCYLRLLSRCTHNHDCMKNVSAAAVIERAESVLSERANKPEHRRRSAPTLGVCRVDLRHRATPHHRLELDHRIVVPDTQQRVIRNDHASERSSAVLTPGLTTPGELSSALHRLAVLDRDRCWHRNEDVVHHPTDLAVFPLGSSCAVGAARRAAVTKQLVRAGGPTTKVRMSRPRSDRQFDLRRLCR